MLTLFVSGLLLGFTAGFTPGPLMALVMSESLQRSWRAGLRVGLAPLITDGPIIALSLCALSFGGGNPALLGIISLCGAAFLLWLAYESFNARMPHSDVSASGHSLTKGVITNLLSPSPWLFWLTVGGPIVVQAGHAGLAGPLLFAVGFYFPLVGTKVVLAIAAERSRTFLKGKWYRWIMQLLGVALVIFAIVIGIDGCRRLC
jgi:threonine/homoserine/homoserine lactone efflux protein